MVARSAPGSLRRTTGMDGQGKSDRLIVLWTPANKGGGAPSPAERVEGQGLAKGNVARRRKSRTQSRSGVNMANPKRAPSGKPRTQPRAQAYVPSADLHQALDRIRQVADRDYPWERLRVTTRGRSPVR